MEFAYSAFCDLTSERPIGFGAGPIPYLRIMEYGLLHGMTGESLSDLLELVQAMDRAYLEHGTREHEKAKVKAGKAGKSTGKNKRHKIGSR